VRRPNVIAARFALFVLVGAGFFDATGTPARAAQPPPSPSAGMGTWVWNEGTVLSSDARRDLLAFARAKNVGVLFVHAAAGFDGAAGFEALATLVAAASRQGLSVVLVGGDPSWSLPAHHADALAFLERSARLRDRLAARGLPSSGRVLFDVEPYVLPQWRTAREPTIAGYVDFLRVLREAGRAASLDVWQTIPFWFHEHQQAGTPLDELVLEQSAGVVLMAYRNRQDEVRSLAAPLLARAVKRGRPVVVAVETMCIDPPRVSYCGQTPTALASALDHLALALRSSPAFAGLAVHNYASWAQLERRAR
jgi:hypothetical protein